MDGGVDAWRWVHDLPPRRRNADLGSGDLRPHWWRPTNDLGAYADLPKQGLALLGLLSAPGEIAVFDLDTGQVVAELSELVDRLVDCVNPLGGAAVYRVDGGAIHRAGSDYTPTYTQWADPTA